MVNKIPSPQSVVVPVDRGVAGVIMDGLWPILGGNHTDAEVWTEIGEVVSSALAAAPAPSSLAGGEVRGAAERLRNIPLSDGGGGYASAVMDAYGHEPVHQLYADLRTILAALSPEAPRDLKTVCQRMADDYQTSDAHHPQHVLVGRADFETMVAALTPRHEALAPTCQKCGGEVQGWTCQECGASFRENDEGSLVFACHEAPAEGAEEAILERLRDIHRRNPSEYAECCSIIDALRARSSAPEAREGEAVACPKCGMLSGDDWKQCGGSCPMPGSPHHTHPAAPSADKLRIALGKIAHSHVSDAKAIALAALKAEGA